MERTAGRSDERGDVAADRGDVAALLGSLAMRVRRALVAAYGVDVGADAAAEAVAWGWEHGRELCAMANPAGYLFRVGQSAAKRAWRRRARRLEFPPEPERVDEPVCYGDVFEELKRLTVAQRTSVLLVHGYGFTYREVAELLAIPEVAVPNHLHPGLLQPRSGLEVEP